MGSENFNRQFILLDFADLDNPDFLSFTRAPEFSTYPVMRRHVWRSAEPHYMGLHDYYARGYLACSLERERIAQLLGISLVSISSDIQALQRRTVIESLRTGPRLVMTWSGLHIASPTGAGLLSPGPADLVAGAWQPLSHPRSFLPAIRSLYV